jgi:hypothetical protein
MEHKNNRWKGLVLGMVGGWVGLVAMKNYWKIVAPQVTEASDTLNSSDVYPEEADFDNIALDEVHYREGESSTAALGRLVYREMTGKQPKSAETKEALSYLIHWLYGLAQGGLYGVFRLGGGKVFDLKGGTAFSTGLWLLGDELAVPLLGFQAGPTAVSPADHFNRLGAHLAYGLATAATTQVLGRIL